MKAAVSLQGRFALPRPTSIMGAILFAYFVAYVFVWAALQGAARVPAVDMLNVAGPLLAFVFCAFAARKASARSLQRFWLLLAASMFLSALAEATWAFYEVVQDIETPFPSVADLFWLLSYPLEFAAIVGLLSFGRKGRLATLGVSLEAVIFSLATVVIVWQFIMLPSLDLEASVLANLVSVAYPGGDVLLLAALASLVLLPRRGTMPRGLLWVAGAFVADVVGDLAYSAAEITGTYSTGSWMDPLWPLAYTLMGAAAVWQLARPRSQTATDSEDARFDAGAGSAGSTFRDQIRAAVPYAAAPIAIFAILYSQINEGDPAYLYTTGPMIGGLVLLGLVLGRQAVTLVEKNRLQGSLTTLSRNLEDRVGQRTKELSLLNEVAVTMSHCGSAKQVIENGLRLAQEALGCEAVGLLLRVSGSRSTFFGGTGLKRPARAQLTAAARQVFKSDKPQEGDKVVHKPVVLSVTEGNGTRLECAGPFGEVAVIPLVSRHASLGGLCLAPWASAPATAEPGDGASATGALAAGAPAAGQPRLELASAVAAQIAVAFENARRFEDAHYLAQRDPVTGLLNHRGMNARLEEELSRCQRVDGSFTIVMMDMDNFKLFNDTYGHAVGDEVLVMVARVLGRAIRKYDVVSRYGGDEFLALLPDTTAEGAVVLVKRLQEAIKEGAFFLEKTTRNRVPIVLSYGIANYPNEGARLPEVLTAADTNLYRSKQRGGNAITAPSGDHKAGEKLGVFNVLDGLVTSVDNKDHYTRQHSDDVCDRAVALASKMGLSDETQRVLRIAGLLHDVGKIGVPDSVLRKPGSLSIEEFETIKQHVSLGKLIIKEIPHLEEVLAAVGTHHERFDGVGYPEGLKGDEIPLLGRILAVTDAYSAMTTDRPYRKGLTVNEAIEELRRVAGKQLDPELVPFFVEVIQDEESRLVTADMTVE